MKIIGIENTEEINEKINKKKQIWISEILLILKY